MVTVAALLWSTGGLIIRLLDTDVWTTVFWRSAFAALFIFAFIAWRDGRNAPALFRAMGLPGIVVGCCYASASTAFVAAVNLTSVANTLVLYSTSPLIAAILAWVLLGERIKPLSWLAMLIAVGGVALMVSGEGGRSSLAGDVLALGIALAHSVATVIIRRQRHVRMVPAMALAMLMATLIAGTQASPGAVGATDFAILIAFGSIQLGSSLAIYSTGARLAPAAKVALLCLLEPVIGPLLVWAMLGDHPGVFALAGGAIVLAALVLHFVVDQRKAKPLAPAA